ncbi:MULTISPECIES: ABC transporter ATP-binding protein [Brevibacillus]|jgi:peptide/nickel transport system ATP-binding protein/oligopeptide transport system ATP-binding protein|uniref:Oligopeptide ABC transporter ATP-binding protein n=1 Tax=Brevibacillus borstelensis AK1 TaxID=1300222 RepID=M8DHD0_9BACL|nr:ABC transporter ATP-binding protein [Brevibacillus borstelensis]EMT52852.1 oligopeptide ABC transporter ATP-binding protein [Brevibacillus borstelensis AK1]MBE5397173.1 ABC transporter ATP-binding protein [Brevibacillus borstelensis]MCC0564888.1 ABC transporter ATP-binding protein [Brevibacillus borstelensis]MCM3470647.1 ABC transporter ATP-binding protein [Brevibacillus borstelensis]MCM3559010.1 ABC transporter ATP-binding protein [Brevibacillus borstelensis]
MEKHLLTIDNLKVNFKTYGGEVQAVRGVSFHVDKGETLAIVGESGCGKSVTAQAIMGLIPNPPGRIVDGKIVFEGSDITHLTKKEWMQIRGSKIGMVFQDPMTALNPTMKVGTQIVEGFIRNHQVTREEAQKRAIEMLRLVGIPDPEKRVDQYPHQFSGGMRQRVVIAIALACQPQLVIADEPTTALDVTIQAQILDLLRRLQEEQELSVVIITHDLGVVSEIAHRMVVMYAGIVVETGTVEDVFAAPRHPYTWGLMRSLPRIDGEEKQRLVPIDGTPPDLFNPPKGCPFAARCDYAMEICNQQMPEISTFEPGHQAACWLHDPRAPRIEELVAAGRQGE